MFPIGLISDFLIFSIAPVYLHLHQILQFHWLAKNTFGRHWMSSDDRMLNWVSKKLKLHKTQRNQQAADLFSVFFFDLFDFDFLMLIDLRSKFSKEQSIFDLLLPIF